MFEDAEVVVKALLFLLESVVAFSFLLETNNLFDDNDEEVAPRNILSIPLIKKRPSFRLSVCQSVCSCSILARVSLHLMTLSNGKFFTFFKRKPKARTRNKPSRNDGMHRR
jgi:hypothetical protein